MPHVQPAIDPRVELLKAAGIAAGLGEELSAAMREAQAALLAGDLPRATKLISRGRRIGERVVVELSLDARR